MRSYIKRSIVCTVACLFPFAVAAKTTAVQEYDFGTPGPVCEGPDCNTVSTCSGYPYACTQTGLKGSGNSCYNTAKKKYFYKKCKCEEGWLPSSEVLLDSGMGTYSEGTAGNGSDLGDGSGIDGDDYPIEPASDGGVTCYKKTYIQCKDKSVQYKGSSLPDASVITTPVTSTILNNNVCIKYKFVPLLSRTHKEDNILCMSDYTCNQSVGCYSDATDAVVGSQTNCFVADNAVLGDASINGRLPACYSVQGCKTTGYCGTAKPSTGFTYVEETLPGVDYVSKTEKSVTCYKATGCINQWFITDGSDPDAFKVMYTDPTTTPSIAGSHVSTDISSMNRTCKRWTACNTAERWEEYTNGRGVGAAQKSAAVVAAAYENNVTYKVSVLSVGTEENMHYFICRRPATIVCPAGTYSDECVEENNCSWINLFLPK